MDPQIWKEIGPYVLPVLVLAIFARRMIRNEPRKVRVGSLWIMPLIILAGVGFTLSVMPGVPDVWVIAAFVAAAAAGAGVGYLRARHMELFVDAKTDTVMSKATPIGMIVIVALFVLRYALKILFPQMQGAQNFDPHGHISTTAIAFTDGGLIFSAAMLTAQAIVTYLRAHPVLTAHHASKAVANEPDVTVLPPEN
ncbi:MAG TPA: hypothetical protein VHW02_08205 [Rhizomicrobium sp.]|jgi:hypothetical protein|nr:hypothetical protein [Rhizomicrobium sp.]